MGDYRGANGDGGSGQRGSTGIESRSKLTMTFNGISPGRVEAAGKPRHPCKKLLGKESNRILRRREKIIELLSFLDVDPAVSRDPY